MRRRLQQHSTSVSLELEVELEVSLHCGALKEVHQGLPEGCIHGPHGCPDVNDVIKLDAFL